DFLRIADHARAEWVNGKVVAMSPVSDRHQAIVELLLSLLTLLVQRDDLGWLRVAPFNMRLPQKPSGREPDLLFVRAARRHLVRPGFLDGAADLVVEVTSPESIGRDRGEKYVEYEAAGIEEYWLIDPERERLELYRLGADRKYVIVPPDGAGVLRSEVITGFWLRVEWLWQEPLPKLVDAARELHLI
ncbi:MAG TPA: Uma2 family endonuclease, partial [Limnochordia bacterium]|nr:Uma2 family endonuclease [Limnochordia bacterium]